MELTLTAQTPEEQEVIYYALGKYIKACDRTVKTQKEYYKKLDIAYDGISDGLMANREIAVKLQKEYKQ